MISNKLLFLFSWLFCLLITFTFAKKKVGKKTEEIFYKCGECCSKYGWYGKTDDYYFIYIYMYHL